METPDDLAAAVSRIADRLEADDTTSWEPDVLPTLRRAADALRGGTTPGRTRMETTYRKPKPRKWQPRKDPKGCIACEKLFVRGDDVYPLTAVAIHAGCVKLYVKQCRELGISP